MHEIRTRLPATFKGVYNNFGLCDIKGKMYPPYSDRLVFYAMEKDTLLFPSYTHGYTTIQVRSGSCFLLDSAITSSKTYIKGSKTFTFSCPFCREPVWLTSRASKACQITAAFPSQAIFCLLIVSQSRSSTRDVTMGILIQLLRKYLSIPQKI